MAKRKRNTPGKAEMLLYVAVFLMEFIQTVILLLLAYYTGLFEQLVQEINFIFQ